MAPQHWVLLCHGRNQNVARLQHSSLVQGLLRAMPYLGRPPQLHVDSMPGWAAAPSAAHWQSLCQAVLPAPGQEERPPAPCQTCQKQPLPCATGCSCQDLQARHARQGLACNSMPLHACPRTAVWNRACTAAFGAAAACLQVLQVIIGTSTATRAHALHQGAASASPQRSALSAAVKMVLNTLSAVASSCFLCSVTSLCT